MNAQLLKRLVKAIASQSTADLNILAKKVVDSERKSGHTKLASELEQILARSQNSIAQTVVKQVDNSLRELPQSRRYQENLATLTEREFLEHHMILPLETEMRFSRIEREYAARDRLHLHGLKYRKTILLYGPPGCGKSLGAKRLAWNLGLPLMKVRFDAILSSYFGESLSNLRSIFDAVKITPCVMLLDECDFIARSREGGKDVGEASRIVNMLLQLMEEFEGPGILVATTNIENSLDDALFRRFDEVLQVPLPGREEIQKLLQSTLSAVKLEDKIHWLKIVEALKGRPAAQIVKVAQDAAKSVLLAGENKVTELSLINACNDLHRRIPNTLH